MKDIFDFPKNTITLDEFENFFTIKEYKDLCNRIMELQLEGKIKAMSPKDVNGRFPPLPKRYRIKRPSEDNGKYLKEMKAELPSRFSLDYYKGNLSKYIEHRKYILMLASYFRQQRQSLEQEMSINERSFAIWQEEKFLKDNPLASAILNNLGLSMESLNVYKTPEPFFYYSKTREGKQNILIIENKDTWYSIRRLMQKGQTSFFGIIFTTVIYGEGKKILSSFQEIEEQEEDYLADKENIFYYFGDLDFEGLSIYNQLKNRFQGIRKICLFKPAYLKMLELAKHDTLQFMKQEQLRKASKGFSGWEKSLGPLSIYRTG